MNTFVAFLIIALCAWILSSLIGVFGWILGIIIFLFLIS